MRQENKGESSAARFRAYSFGCFLLFLGFLLLPAVVPADESRPKVNGYVKTILILNDVSGSDVLIAGNTLEDRPEVAWTSITTLRLSLFWQRGESASAELAYELIPRVQDDSVESFFALQAANPLTYRAVDFSEEITVTGDASSLNIFQNLDRAFVTLSPSFGDISIGRQPVAFGSARFINPTDILTSFSYIELNSEERIGVDAVRVRVPVGARGELDAGTVFGDDFRLTESAAFLRMRLPVLGMDFSPIAVLFKENVLLGVDIATSIGGAGFWFEGAYTFANLADHHEADQDYMRLSTGFDYSFTDTLYASIEYHYNSAGSSDPDDYDEILNGLEKEIAYTEGAVYLLGSHYIAPGFTWQASPLMSFSSRVLFNWGDRSLLFFPDMQYSMSDNAVLEAGAFISVGSESDIVINRDSGSAAVSAESEFGLYPDTYFISVRIYF
jgi:hypothetical protein